MPTDKNIYIRDDNDNIFLIARIRGVIDVLNIADEEIRVFEKTTEDIRAKDRLRNK